jgi:hypothetical protein
MNHRPRLMLLTAAAVLLFSPLALQAAEKGWFGFALTIDADGILHPKLRSIKIDKIFPASPAANAGLALRCRGARHSSQAHYNAPVRQRPRPERI